MRKPFLAGNWKMNCLNANEALALVSGIHEGIKSDRDVAVCVPSIYIYLIAEYLKKVKSTVQLGAQNFYWEEKGAFTGEISGPMLKAANVPYVIIGHSERRQYFKENDQDVNKKIKAALKYGLKPIVCVGETLDQRKAGITQSHITHQIQAAFEGLTDIDFALCTIAYEPIWAIGTGINATPEQAQEVHVWIREIVSNIFKNASESIRIIYGGSVTAQNIDAIMSQPDVDGALVGGASLKADSFLRIIHFENSLVVSKGEK